MKSSEDKTKDGNNCILLDVIKHISQKFSPIRVEIQNQQDQQNRR